VGRRMTWVWFGIGVLVGLVICFFIDSRWKWE
jgi:hypothetical protein